jgi:N-hydroxyarylamine O-acetyltransferase
MGSGSAGLDGPTRERLLRRIGLDERPPASEAGLRTTVRAFVASVPFEDLAVQLGESGPLDPTAAVDRMLEGGRGGYCFEVNTVLRELLVALGFEVERREAIVGERSAFAHGEPTNHLALVVRAPGAGPFVAEAGWGEGPIEPLPLAPGRYRVGAFEYGVERDGDGWWVAQHEHGSTPGLRFADDAAALADFAAHHERLSTAPDSGFVRTLLVQQPFADRIVTLRARTRFVDGPSVRERRVLANADELAAVLEGDFGIDPAALGPGRLGRLWAYAVAQHDAHREQEAPSRYPE